MSEIFSAISEALPVRLDRRAGAAMICRHFFPVSARTLERWPIAWQRINGRALALTSELLAEAQRRVDEAAVVRGGHRVP